MLLRISIVGLLLLGLQAASADTLTGRVVGIADGDTLTVLDASNQQHKIRLSSIDAPEKNQPFGQVSKQSLSDQVFDRQISIETNKVDRYGREIGKVLIGGVDANLEQVKQGLAWHYKKYQDEQPLEDRLNYQQAEEAARKSRIGLWSVADPIPPWEWRHSRKH